MLVRSFAALNDGEVMLIELQATQHTLIRTVRAASRPTDNCHSSLQHRLLRRLMLATRRTPTLMVSRVFPPMDSSPWSRQLHLPLPHTHAIQPIATQMALLAFLSLAT